MNGKSNHAYYPIVLEICKKVCVVVGGGTVAARKVVSLLHYGANVTVVSCAFCEELRQLSRRCLIHLIEEDFVPGHITNAFLVIAATDNNKINELVAAEAHLRKILVNVVDNAKLSDFIMPASLCRGNLTIAVSTAGKSPALARKIKDKLEGEFENEYAILIDLVAEIRSEIKKIHSSVSNDAWQQSIDLDTLLSLLKNGQIESAKSLLWENLSHRTRD